jgi:glycine cleavage system aminomethyltransferase T
MPLYRSPLEAVMRRAGAVMVPREGWCVAAHYGSPAGELAVCSSGVGMVDRSDLGKLELCGDPDVVDLVVSDISDGQVEPNEVLRAGGVRWCAASPDRLFALCEPAQLCDLSERLNEAVGSAPRALLTDETDELAALALLGPAAPAVVAALGAWSLDTIALPRPSFSATELDGLPVYLLEESSTRALILVERLYAEQLWNVLEDAGRQFGLSCVGMEAAERFSMIERQLLGRSARPPSFA